MTSDWTLKDKSQLWDDMCTDVYSKGTINHLRLELIEDLDEWNNDMNIPSFGIFKELDVNELKNIINKRFGVD